MSDHPNIAVPSRAEISVVRKKNEPCWRLKPISHKHISLAVTAESKSCAHLIKVLQQVHYTALDLILRKTSGSRVETRSLSVEDRDELRWANSRSDLNARSSSPDGARDGSSQRAHNSGAKHFDNSVSGAYQNINNNVKWEQRGSVERNWQMVEVTRKRDEVLKFNFLPSSPTFSTRQSPQPIRRHTKGMT